ncbi:hypothetical protein DOY81_005496, partial [Sarcophaga bullata]
GTGLQINNTSKRIINKSLKRRKRKRIEISNHYMFSGGGNSIYYSK